jgi:NAD(P)-dependent dehydrogenase (short-subunit alcohol dehydrogenase family)
MSTFVVIGASSGIGLELAKQLATAGHEVVASYHKHRPEVPLKGVSYYNLDILQDEPDLSFLPPAIHGLAYCPGSIHLKPFNRIKEADFLADYRLEVLGAVKILQAAFPLLKAAGNAAVLLYSTVAVQLGLPYHSLVSMSKGAVEGLTKALAAEWAPHIRVNCIAPSLTDTPLAAGLLNTPEKRAAGAQRHPLMRIGNAADIANLSLFLLTDISSWITGQVIHADGGMSNLRV